MIFSAIAVLILLVLSIEFCMNVLTGNTKINLGTSIIFVACFAFVLFFAISYAEYSGKESTEEPKQEEKTVLVTDDKPEQNKNIIAKKDSQKITKKTDNVMLTEDNEKPNFKDVILVFLAFSACLAIGMFLLRLAN